MLEAIGGWVCQRFWQAHSKARLITQTATDLLTVPALPEVVDFESGDFRFSVSWSFIHYYYAVYHTFAFGSPSSAQNSISPSTLMLPFCTDSPFFASISSSVIFVSENICHSLISHSPVDFGHLD